MAAERHLEKQIDGANPNRKKKKKGLFKHPNTSAGAPANHRADSFSAWHEAVVDVALPSLLSFRKLGFSITTATELAWLLVLSRVVRARFSAALVESPSLRITGFRGVLEERDPAGSRFSF